MVFIEASMYFMYELKNAFPWNENGLSGSKHSFRENMQNYMYNKLVINTMKNIKIKYKQQQKHRKNPEKKKTRTHA